MVVCIQITPMQSLSWMPWQYMSSEVPSSFGEMLQSHAAGSAVGMWSLTFSEVAFFFPKENDRVNIIFSMSHTSYSLYSFGAASPALLSPLL